MRDAVSILEGNTFVVSDRSGDIDASPTDTSGLFHTDMRHLSKWILSIDGKRLGVLSIDDLQYFSAQFFLVPSTGTVYTDSKISIVRRRAVSDGFHEEIVIENQSPEPVTLDVRIEAGADFADLFEVKDALRKKGRLYSRVAGTKLLFGYQREKFIRETWVTSSTPARFDDHGISYTASIPSHGVWKTSLSVFAARTGMDVNHRKQKYHSVDDRARPNMALSLEEWLQRAPVLSSSWDAFSRIYRRSLVDLAALRFYTLLFPHDSLPAAGLPWFMAIFGRDSIITSFQALPFESELAATTLKLLAARQGTTVDVFRDEEPGKILHESRLGELTAFEERPHSPYFGTADATPLFLILLDEYERWTGNGLLVRDLEQSARAALEWIDRYGDSDGDGYIEYNRKNKESGLENQCWKDSWDSIRYSDGSITSLPRATCEIQGYVYDAKLRTARLAEEYWDDEKLAKRLRKDAATLKKKFNKDFWVSKRKFFALALDGEKKQVDSLTSNIGHLLWSGIVEDDKIQATVDSLMSDELFSGWGVRTMATTEGGYNPIGYHVGTVWPHDNSIVALGLRRAGYKKEAARIAMGILDAAPYFQHRLPEAFAGFPRTQTHFPVEYPTACSPQAWATGAPLLLIRTLLGLEPVDGKLTIDPAIPRQIENLTLLNIPGAWGKLDAFGRGLVPL